MPTICNAANAVERFRQCLPSQRLNPTIQRKRKTDLNWLPATKFNLRPSMRSQLSVTVTSTLRRVSPVRGAYLSVGLYRAENCRANAVISLVLGGVI